MMLSNLCRFSHSRTLRIFGLCAALSFLSTNALAQSTSGTIVLTGADRRPATSLSGEWATIVDPFFSGLFSFHHVEKKNGFFLNQKAKPGDPFPTEYDFSKAPKLKVPGDWNTQRESLIFYEGPIWYERDFAYEPKPGTHERVRSSSISRKLPVKPLFASGANEYRALFLTRLDQNVPRVPIRLAQCVPHCV